MVMWWRRERQPLAAAVKSALHEPMAFVISSWQLVNPWSLQEALGSETHFMWASFSKPELKKRDMQLSALLSLAKHLVLLWSLILVPERKNFIALSMLVLKEHLLKCKGVLRQNYCKLLHFCEFHKIRRTLLS